MSSYEKELSVAVDAVLQAMKVCEAVRVELVGDDTLAKRDRSPVTVADFSSQAVVLDVLRDAFPEDPVVAEEESSALQSPSGSAMCERVVSYVQQARSAMSADDVLSAIDRGAHAGGPQGRFWVLDPIDGTKGFLRNDQYAVALGLIENGRVVLGILGAPRLPETAVGDDSPAGVLCAAVRGEGAFMLTPDGQRRPLHVSANDDSSLSAFCESVESGHSAHDVSVKVAEQLGINRDSVRLDSQCKYAVVARGEAEIYMRLPTRADYRECIWDHAAGVIVVEEAGGRVTDIDGRELDFTLGRTLSDNRGIIATNGLLHDAVIDAIAATGEF